MGRNRPAEAMPFDGIVRRYFDDIYIVNLFTNKQMLATQINRLCARCCTQHLTHTRSGKRHVEPTIGWLCVLRFNSEKSVIVAALLASPMTPFSRLLSHEHYLSLFVTGMIFSRMATGDDEYNDDDNDNDDDDDDDGNDNDDSNDNGNDVTGDGATGYDNNGDGQRRQRRQWQQRNGQRSRR